MYNVLIVDDEPIVAEALIISPIWDDLGLEVLGNAYSGLDALDWMDKYPVDILITDIRMPQMDGIELIQHIREKGLHVKIVILSGHDDFSYVKEAIKLGVENYLLKPLDKSELLATLTGVVDKLQADSNRQINMNEQMNAFRESFLLRWVTNSVNKTEFREKAEIARFDTNIDEYRIVLFKILNLDNNLEKHRGALAIQEFLSQQFGATLKDLSFFDSSYDLVAVLPERYFKCEDLSLQDRLSSILTLLTAQTELQLLCTIGQIESDLFTAYRSYNTAKELQGYAFLLPPNSLITSDDIEKNRNDGEWYLDLPLEQINNFILSNKKEECLEITRIAFTKIHGNSQITPVMFKNAILELLFQVSNTVKNTIIHPECIPLSFRNLYHRFAVSDKYEDLIGLVYETIRTACDLLSVRDNATNATIKQILDYVKENSEQDLSLKTLSFQFNVNASYLGQLFRKETGILFSSYLNHLRIEKAKELLIHTDMKVTDISAKVGYLEPSHFYKIFKKATGVSPAQYK
ncbi:response regulator transcription factor [Paenibacillus roseipurpureus]|uniref:Response regulator n=1 Tax=Paenibacillus roseopurpureus TaxID=2918901 RepID=A0AA96LLE7_9BACL|nr:response regulator [Paenibacillus sp. MBLB1832]WNR42761.1 response regulator [Paenibacillus sp. MBLB1832]